METRKFLQQMFVTTVLALTLSACKVDLLVGPGGRVESESGAYSCEAGQTCTVDVVDLFFDETFVATADGNHTFVGWKTGNSRFCGGRMAPCRLFTAGLAGNANLMAILESDRVFYLEPEFLEAPRLAQEELTTFGQIVETVDGFDLEGTLSLEGATPVGQVFEDANLSVSFDENGDLLSLVGESLIPPQVTNNLGVIGSVRTDVGLFTGAEINADDAFEIKLLDSRQYLVFLASTAMDLELGDRDGGQTISISTPLSGKVVVISDLLDEMYYYYGEIAGEVRAQGKSDQGLIPFTPKVDFAPIDEFLGHDYKRQATSVGIKVFDLLSLDGEYVIKNPTFAEINLEDPFNSEVGFFAGYNGVAEIAFSVFGFGLFELDLAETSGSIKFQPLQPGTSNRFSLYGKVAPDVSWQPDWFQIFPETELQADLSADAAGNVDMNLRGVYNSLLPEAELEGAIHLDEAGTTMSAVVNSPIKRLPVSIRFADGETHAVVGIDVDTQDLVQAQIDYAFDLAEQEVLQAQQDLENALTDYELELSLNGLREDIPGIASTAINALNAVPGQVYSSVYNQVRNEITARRYCAVWLWDFYAWDYYCASYLPTNATRDSKATSAANSARSQASSTIAPYVTALVNLRDRAADADDDTVREALRQALLSAYDHRQVYKKITVTVSISGIASFTKSYTINRTVLSDSLAAQVLAAANNIHRIPETEGIMIGAQDILDQLPTEEIIQQVRDEVESGARLVPGISEVGYSVVNGQYSAHVLLSNGEQYTVEFNVLDPDEALLALAELLVDSLTGG